MKKLATYAAAFVAAMLFLAVAQEEAGPSLSLAEGDVGEYLVDGNGMSLYLFANEEPGGDPVCYDNCATNWPPFIVDADTPVGATDGLDADLVGTVERSDGSLQVTYAGWPLYYWIGDAEAGETNGHGVGGNWWLISAAGEAIGAE